MLVYKMPRKLLTNKVYTAFVLRWIYALIDNELYYVKIINVNWFSNSMIVQAKEGWIYILNPFDYGITWSISKHELQGGK